MPRKEIELIVRSKSEERGVELDDLIDALKAVERLHASVASSILRPGATEVRIPEGAKDLVQLSVVKAEPRNSLNVALSLPSQEGYESDYKTLANSSNRLFLDTLKAAVKKDADKLVELYPEKADRLRVLKRIVDLSGGEHRAPVSFVSLEKAGDVSHFTPSHVEWARENYPSFEPERKWFQGVIRQGQLGGKFSIFDGDETVTLAPNEGETALLRNLFGKVAEVEGLAHFREDGTLKYVDKLTVIEPYEYRTGEIETPSRIFYLKRELVFTASAGIFAKEFLLENEELGLYGQGRSLKEAIEEAEGNFAAQYDGIASADDDELHPSAIRLKKQILSLVKTVEKKDGE